MAQRVMIAMALACEPDLLIADEPTTALDVTIQAQILDLMRHLRDEIGTAIILITHDLGVVAEMCDRVAVMYAGEIVEQTDVGTLFREPLHPYTRGLIGSIPVVGEIRDELAVIPGNVPNLIDLPTGCRFAPRCAARVEHDVTLATDAHPDLRPIATGHDVRCWLYHDESGRSCATALTPIREAAPAEVAAVLEADEIAADAAALAASRAVAAPTGRRRRRRCRRRLRARPTTDARRRVGAAIPAGRTPRRGRAARRRASTSSSTSRSRAGSSSGTVATVQAVDGVSFESAAARRSGWSASRAAARRPSAGCSFASSTRRRARSGSTATTSRR